MDFSLKTRTEGDVVIIETTGYLNNVGGEQIANNCYKEMESGKKLFLLNLENLIYVCQRKIDQIKTSQLFLNLR